jgi:hypothetical protein
MSHRVEPRNVVAVEWTVPDGSPGSGHKIRGQIIDRTKTSAKVR